MSLGLFVEGQSDKDTIPILTRKLGYRSAVNTRVIPQGLMLRSDRVKPYIERCLLRTFVAFIDALGLSPEFGRSGSR